MIQLPGITDAQRAALADVQLDHEAARFFDSLPADRQLQIRTRVLELVDAGIQVDCERFVLSGTLNRAQWRRALREWRPN